MKLSAAALVCVMFFGTTGCISSSVGTASLSATQSSQAVENLEARRLAAISNADFDGLASLLADDYVHVLGNGAQLDKPAYIASVRQIPRVPTRGPLTIRIYGDVAVLTGEFINRMQIPNQPARVMKAYVTQIARRVHGQWQFEIFQLTLEQTAPR